MALFWRRVIAVQDRQKRLEVARANIFVSPLVATTKLHYLENAGRRRRRTIHRPLTNFGSKMKDGRTVDPTSNGIGKTGSAIFGICCGSDAAFIFLCLRAQSHKNPYAIDNVGSMLVVDISGLVPSG